MKKLPAGTAIPPSPDIRSSAAGPSCLSSPQTPGAPHPSGDCLAAKETINARREKT